MLKASVIVFACLSLALCSVNLRHYPFPTQRSQPVTKDHRPWLISIEEEQRKQSKRMDDIHEKLDRLESAVTKNLEMAARRMEHGLHKLQDNVAKLEKSQGEVTQFLDTNRQLLEKVSGSCVEASRRGIILESQLRDGLCPIIATRRDLNDGIMYLTKIHNETRIQLSSKLEATLALGLVNSTRHYSMMQDMLDTQKRLVDSCQPVQEDDPKPVLDILDNFAVKLLNKTAKAYYQIKNVQNMLTNLNKKYTKITNDRYSQNDETCKKLETTLRTFKFKKDEELSQLTNKFVDLTERADEALQKLEARLSNDDEPYETFEATDSKNDKEDYENGFWERERKESSEDKGDPIDSVWDLRHIFRKG